MQPMCNGKCHPSNIVTSQFYLVPYLPQPVCTSLTQTKASFLVRSAVNVRIYINGLHFHQQQDIIYIAKPAGCLLAWPETSEWSTPAKGLSFCNSLSQNVWWIHLYKSIFKFTSFHRNFLEELLYFLVCIHLLWPTYHIIFLLL